MSEDKKRVAVRVSGRGKITLIRTTLRSDGDPIAIADDATVEVSDCWLNGQHVPWSNKP